MCVVGALLLCKRISFPAFTKYLFYFCKVRFQLLIPSSPHYFQIGNLRGRRRGVRTGAQSHRSRGGWTILSWFRHDECFLARTSRWICAVRLAAELSSRCVDEESSSKPLWRFTMCSDKFSLLTNTNFRRGRYVLFEAEGKIKVWDELLKQLRLITKLTLARIFI